MKKIMAFLFAILMLCSCAAENNETNQENENFGEDEWGITLSVENISPTGATVVFTQSGGNPTGELTTGSYYRVEKDGKELPYVLEGDIAWTAEAYMIMPEKTFSMEANWEWLYGKLEPGEYRIFKGVSDFRGPGDSDSKEYFADFTIE